MPKLCENSEQNQQLLPSEASVTQKFKVRALNLGGWLVAEGWIKPSLFDRIPNKDFLDGTMVQFKSVTLCKYLCAEAGGGENIAANRTDPSGQLGNIQRNGIDIVAVAKTPGESETFEIVKGPRNSSRIRIKVPNGSFLQVNAEGRVTADSTRDGNWGDNDPSVFVITIFEGPLGEFQVTNGYGPVLAPQVMQEHWSTLVVENNFKFISRNELNAVRIPVGWWIVSDPTPPLPYVGGSSQALDNAFLWAQALKMVGTTVLLEMSLKNGDCPTKTYNRRYAENPSLYAVELINEPLSPGVSLHILTKYYCDGYQAVRNNSM